MTAKMSRLAPSLHVLWRPRRWFSSSNPHGVDKDRAAVVGWWAVGLVRGGGGWRCGLWCARDSTRCDGLGLVAARKTCSRCCAKKRQQQKKSALAPRLMFTYHTHFIHVRHNVCVKCWYALHDCATQSAVDCGAQW